MISRTNPGSPARGEEGGGGGGGARGDGRRASDARSAGCTCIAGHTHVHETASGSTPARRVGAVLCAPPTLPLLPPWPGASSCVRACARGELASTRWRWVLLSSRETLGGTAESPATPDGVMEQHRCAPTTAYMIPLRPWITLCGRWRRPLVLLDPHRLTAANAARRHRPRRPWPPSAGSIFFSSPRRPQRAPTARDHALWCDDRPDHRPPCDEPTSSAPPPSVRTTSYVRWRTRC